MKKLILLVAVIALAALALYALLSRGLSWVWADEAVASSAARPWPGGLGTLETVAARYPPLQSNAAAARLIALVDALPAQKEIEAFVSREVARGDAGIGESPALPDVSSIRELLLREAIVWARSGRIGEIGDTATQERRGVQMRGGRALISSALANGSEAASC